MKEYKVIGTGKLPGPEKKKVNVWKDAEGYLCERVIITYVSPIGDYSSYKMQQCIICLKNNFIKVAYDMFRELDGLDTTAEKVMTYRSLEDLEKYYQIRKDLLWQETIMKKKLIRKKYENYSSHQTKRRNHYVIVSNQ